MKMLVGVLVSVSATPDSLFCSLSVIFGSSNREMPLLIRISANYNASVCRRDEVGAWVGMMEWRIKYSNDLGKIIIVMEFKKARLTQFISLCNGLVVFGVNCERNSFQYLGFFGIFDCIITIIGGKYNK